MCGPPGGGGIVNPAKLSPERRMEVCMQCHLETTSGRIPAVLQRFDRGDILLYSWAAVGGFRDFFRPCAGYRPRRQIRGGKLGLPAAAIALFPGKRR